MLKQSLHYKLLQKLSPQQIQLMKLIQLPTQAFEERLKQEIEENPALDTGKEDSDSIDDDLSNEFDDTGTEKIEAEDINIDDYLSDDEIPNYKTQANNYSADDEEKNVPYAAGTSFHQSLKNQLSTYSFGDEERLIAEFLVGSIDDSGYIRRDLLDLVDDLAFTANIFTTKEKVFTILKKVIHTLDPSGVGARDLKECLIIQLKRKKVTKTRALAIDILESNFDHFVKKHFTKLKEKFNISNDELKEVNTEISKLNPKPGSSYAGNNKIAEQIVPDFSIKLVNGELDLILNSRNAPELHHIVFTTWILMKITVFSTIVTPNGRRKSSLFLLFQKTEKRMRKPKSEIITFVQRIQLFQAHGIRPCTLFPLQLFEGIVEKTHLQKHTHFRK